MEDTENSQLVPTIRPVNTSKKKKKKQKNLLIVQNVMEKSLKREHAKGNFSMAVPISRNVILLLGTNQRVPNAQNAITY